MVPGMDFPDKFREAREEVGLDQADIARQLGISASSVSQWEGGKTHPSKKHWPALCVMLKVDPSFFLDITPVIESDVSAPVETSLPAAAEMPRDVPIYGLAAAAHRSDGALNMLPGIVDRGRRPPALSAARDLYGLFIASDSMEPVYRRGDLVYVRSRLQPRIGDDVIIQVASPNDGDQPACFIKRLVRRTADRIIAEQFNPPQQIEFAVSEVIAIHRVLTMGEALGT